MAHPQPSTVLLLGYPTELGRRQDEHFEDVLREFQLMAVAAAHRDPAAPPPSHPVPPALTALVEHLFTQYATELDEPTRVRQEALEAGLATVDVSYPVLPETREITLAWRRMMDAVDVFCRAGDLLSLETPPDLLALREWVLTEFLAQLDGADPTPWTGPLT